MLCEKRIIFDFTGQNLKPVDFSYLQISSMVDSMSALDLLIFLLLQYMLLSSANRMVFSEPGITFGNLFMAIE